MNLQEHIRRVLKEEIISLKDNPVKYYIIIIKKRNMKFEGLY